MCASVHAFALHVMPIARAGLDRERWPADHVEWLSLAVAAPADLRPTIPAFVSRECAWGGESCALYLYRWCLDALVLMRCASRGICYTT